MVIGLGGAVTDALVDDVAARFGGLEAVATPAPPVTDLPADQRAHASASSAATPTRRT